MFFSSVSIEILFSSVSIVDFEQIKVSLATIGSSKQRQILAKVSVFGVFLVRIFGEIRSMDTFHAVSSFILAGLQKQFFSQETLKDAEN